MDFRKCVSNVREVHFFDVIKNSYFYFSFRIIKNMIVKREIVSKFEFDNF